jgi:hypothetical protein
MAGYVSTKTYTEQQPGCSFVAQAFTRSKHASAHHASDGRQDWSGLETKGGSKAKGQFQAERYACPLTAIQKCLK